MGCSLEIVRPALSFDNIFNQSDKLIGLGKMLPHILHLEAEPQYSRSQVQPGNEIREVEPAVVQDLS